MVRYKKNVIKENIVKMLLVFIFILIVLKIVYFEDSIITIISISSYFYYLFLLPGGFILLYLHKKLGFLERFIFGTLLSLGLLSISSYYLSLIFGFHVKYHGYFLPPLIIVIGLLLFYKEK